VKSKRVNSFTCRLLERLDGTRDKDTKGANIADKEETKIDRLVLRQRQSYINIDKDRDKARRKDKDRDEDTENDRQTEVRINTKIDRQR
jgi:hypothetical protein